MYFIDAPQVAAVTGLDLESAYFQLDADQPGGLGMISLPQLEAGPYLSYGLQWLAFGIMAPLGLGYFVRAELREHRKAKITQADPANGDRPKNPHGGREAR